MSFDVSADAYDRFMGRYSATLSRQLADLVGVVAGQRALDVGCGSGMLTAELVARLGAESVAAIDPSAPFVEAVGSRFPGVDVRRSTAEELPFDDGEFDAALSQLVVHFMRDAVQGLREMARVTRPAGAVAASVWDLAGGRAPISPFWRAAVALDPNARDEMAVTGGRAGHLEALFAEAGIEDVRAVEQPAVVEHQTFDEWFGPFTLGVGPAGSYLVGIDEERQAAVRERCRAELGDGPFTIPSFVWAATGVSPGR
ncbi:MAG TPA: class I SAM-dependent methyltransferase [Gaiellales bacterium]|jgi:SAM-dependent methyltransferase|nr:class I SAM-dependent methyltransferase [Gaiellales bacterium]